MSEYRQTSHVLVTGSRPVHARNDNSFFRHSRRSRQGMSGTQNQGRKLKAGIQTQGRERTVVAVAYFRFLIWPLHCLLYKTTGVVLCALLFVLFAPPAAAHDPGLSIVHLQVDDGSISARLTFVRRDVEQLISLDGDGDGDVSEAEFFAARRNLTGLFPQLVAVTAGTQEIPVSTVSVQWDPSDAVHFSADFPHVSRGSIAIRSPVIAQLARGHRQYVTIKDSRDRLLAEWLSDSDAARLIDLQEQRAGGSSVFVQYVGQGMLHIGIGFDHILFLVTLMLPAVLVYRERCWQPVSALSAAFFDILKIVTAFTVAHATTLSLAALGKMVVPAQVVEPVIAASVIVSALNNVIPRLYSQRWLLAFGFGLIHGLGFASALSDLGLPRTGLVTALIGFNLGVEAGQVIIVLLLLPLAYFLRATRAYRVGVLQGGSVTVAVIASVWMFERLAAT